MPETNIVRTIRAETKSYRNRVAVIEGDRRISYAQLLAGVDAMAEALLALGVARGDRVAFLCEDGADYIAASLAVLSIPAVMVPLSPSLTEEEITQAIERMDVHFLVFDAALRDHDSAARLHPGSWFEKTLHLTAREAGAPPDGYREMNAAFIRFSSGTTGISKGVLLTHDALLARTTAADTGLRMSPDDVVLWTLSMSFHFVVTILLFLRRSATLVMCYQPFLGAIREGLVRHHGTFIYASPFHYHSLAASREFDATSFSRVRLAISTAMDLPRSTAEAFVARFGLPLSGAYGIIEVGLPCVDSGEEKRKPGSVGRVLPAYDVKIAEPDAHGVGKILLRGPGMFDAYYSPWRGIGRTSGPSPNGFVSDNWNSVK